VTKKSGTSKIDTEDGLIDRKSSDVDPPTFWFLSNICFPDQNCLCSLLVMVIWSYGHWSWSWSKNRNMYSRPTQMAYPEISLISLWGFSLGKNSNEKSVRITTVIKVFEKNESSHATALFVHLPSFFYFFVTRLPLKQFLHLGLQCS
jgi:hypothetical protein